MNKTRALVDADLLSRIAWLYFMKSHTQRDISQMLNLSRMQVQRSISKSKKIGLVKIQILDPLITCFEKEDALKGQFSISDAVVVPTPQDKSKLKEALGKAAAAYLLSRVGDNQVIGVGWGTTLQQITKFISRKPLGNSHIVSLVGGWTKRVDESPYEVAGRLADALSTDCYYISAPAVVNSAESKSVIVSENIVNHALEMGKRADLAVLGIGNADVDSSLVKVGLLSPEEVKGLRGMGAVGDIFAQFYSRDGVPIDCGYMKRVIGIALDDLRRIRTVIGVAGGKNKRAAISGALAGGFLDALITDEQTAMGVLSFSSSVNKKA